MIKKLLILLTVSSMVYMATAEFRTWTDQNGNQIEAEFVGSSGKSIVLKKVDGTQFSIDPMKLSDEDKEYLKGKVPDDLIDESKSALDRPNPLRIEVKLSKKTDTLKNEDMRNRDITLVAKIRKRSLEPYTRKLTAEMFLVGIHKEDGYLVMLDRKKIEFDLADSDDATLEGKTAHIRWLQNSKAGIEYEGNVVVIRDDEGNILDVSGSNRTFERSYEQLSKFNRDEVFTEKTYIKKGTRASLNIDTRQKKNLYL